MVSQPLAIALVVAVNVRSWHASWGIDGKVFSDIMASGDLTL
ncbi:hypothetical protein ABK905_02175 [Acerihabitans sp. KWT182]|uniref:Uncharacterized protein n=1 Tax=Acerihabitans sp. KWT182 TaxID=3157919 RepID=A0AAU7QAJ6_9GAMM